MPVTILDKKPLQTADLERQFARPPLFARILKNLIWLALSSVLLVVMVEGIFSAARVGEEEFLTVDPVVGFWHQKGKDFVFRKEGYSHSVINSAGFRDIEYPAAKPSGTIRIAVLGDSQTEGLQVPLEQTFIKVLERQLRRDTGKNIEVMNFAMSGFSTGQEYLLFKDRVLDYNPDIAILAYNVNDSDENMCPGTALNSMPRPYFGIYGSRMFIDWSRLREWMQGEKARLLTSCKTITSSRAWGVWSQLELGLAADPTYNLLQKTILKPVASAWSAMVLCLEPPKWVEPQIALPPVPSSTQVTAPKIDSKTEWSAIFTSALDRWNVSAALIAAFNTECKKHNCKLIVAGMPAPDNSLAYFRELRLLKDQAARDGFAFVNVHAAFPALAPTDKNEYFFQMHFTERGHVLAEKSLLPTVLKQVQELR